MNVMAVLVLKHKMVLCFFWLLRQDSRLWTIALLSCPWTYFTRTIHLVLAYLAALIPLVEVYSIIDVYVFVVSWSRRLLTAGFCSKGKYRVNIVHITTMKTMNPELFYLYRLQILACWSHTDNIDIQNPCKTAGSYRSLLHIAYIFMQQFWWGSNVDNQWADKSYYT